MKKFILPIALVTIIASCNNNANKSGEDSTDSVTTDSLKNPSFNPEVEADSATKQMNLDSGEVKKQEVKK